ncbi:putative membrane protein [Mycolicibacterium sp. BK556]|uniref:anthrone oxygenase family protein n=1 Tax=unclassified Mycolicibacterium TaxID=2636767 RepID=UPI001619964D|nr:MULTISPECIES: anthrone oxygenase family protein [unclassified Mycolicibacterium]MBB3601488.1 putative membrane protein [Mycolicibacterium sp. BK556]MBB3631240.1 putative membrane protein [Mycolicibacterium sp. BK607]MBB3749244.1 putative membrane protein [Mycolicibacterium sp. BK634]
MSSSPVMYLATVAAVSAAAVGGLFYAFSTFVMRGLDRTGPVQAATAMRGINAEAQANAPFLTLFLGSALIALVVGVAAVTQLRVPGSAWLLAGALLALVPLVVTVACNVPLNNRLDAGLPWQDYYRTWTLWNHVRTIAPLAGSVLIVIGVRLR